MALNVWTKPSGYNFGSEPGLNQSVNSGNFVAGERYVIQTVGTTDFTKVGAAYNTVGLVFRATNSGSEAGPVNTSSGSPVPTPGSGVASKLAFNERNPVNLLLPVTNDAGVAYSKITGDLPPGLRLEGKTIVGSPYEVPRITDFTFVIRASKTTNNITEVADRTFTITIEGEDKPTFVTPEGLLNIGDPGELFVIDSTYVDYQLSAVDTDTSTGQRLSYFIADNEGALPPGLILTDDGRIVGFVQPVLSIKPTDGDGSYDNSYYDAVAFDFAFVPTNGYDSYIYDSIFFDFSLPSSKPKKLNRTYEFIVTVSDGDSFQKRKFKIFVVGDDFFRADNTTWLDGNSMFTADVTYIRSPIWLTPSYLGLYRANNYITLILDTYDKENVIYSLEQINADVRAETRKISSTDNVVGGYTLTTTLTTSAPQINQKLTFNGRVTGTNQVNTITNVTSLGNGEYRLTLYLPLDVTIPDGVSFLMGDLSQLPPGMEFDENNSEVFGQVPYQPAITKTYKFTVTATRISDKGEKASTPKIFTVDLLGEVDSVLSWNTPSDLGAVNANFISTLSVNASSTVPGATLLYTVTSGSLPPGLSLDLDGEIVGKVNQYGTSTTSGLTTFSEYSGSGMNQGTVTFSNVTFDGGTTSLDRVYEFTVQARDQYGFSAIGRTFKIAIDTPNQKVFSNIKVKPFLKTSQRDLWRAFINNTSIFTPSSIYRPNDINFGIQTDLSMLVYAGIETRDAASYISAMGLNHKRKRFQFNNIKKATAYLPGTQTAVYEIVYVEMLDPLEANGKHLANKLTNLSKQPNKITVDNSNIIWSRNVNDLGINAPNSIRPEPIMNVNSTGYEVSNPNVNEYFPSSISIWRERLKDWVDKDSNGNAVSFATERNYLPLWMRSIQPGTKEELDFQLAVPLCYCKVGTADDIILNIKNYVETTGFSFNKLDYTTDRYIIDSVEGQTQDKYLVFRNDRITI